MNSPTSRVVTGLDVNVVVGSCLVGMLSSIFNLCNTQKINQRLKEVILRILLVTHDYYYGSFRKFKVDDNLAALSNSNAAVQKVLTEKRKAILLTVTVFVWIFAMLGNKFERATY